MSVKPQSRNSGKMYGLRRSLRIENKTIAKDNTQFMKNLVGSVKSIAAVQKFVNTNSITYRMKQELTVVASNA